LAQARGSAAPFRGGAAIGPAMMAAVAAPQPLLLPPAARLPLWQAPAATGESLQRAAPSRRRPAAASTAPWPALASGLAAGCLAAGARLGQRRRQPCQGGAGHARQRVARRAKAYRMPLPPNVDEIEAPRWKVLMDAVKVKDAEDAVIPDWKLKPRLGIYSPTPQYKPLHYIEPKPYWMKAAFVKRKQKKFYKKLMLRRMEKENIKLRYLPDPKDRLTLATRQLHASTSVFKTEDADVFKTLRKMSTEELIDAMNDQKTQRLGLAGKPIPLNWRPGFQTAAIRDLKDYLKRVDVVLEVRDARIPWATKHPDIPEWVRPKPRVIVLTKADLIPPQCLEETIQYIKESEDDRGIPVVAIDAQRGGDAIEDLRRELMKAGAYVNRRRQRKGINPRAVRTMMIGFPNVGKSSIINRLSGRKVAKRTNWAGSTRRLTWHKIGGFRNTELEFLDSPGVIPVMFGKRYTEEQGALLCMCRVFGEKHIDREKTAYELVRLLGKLKRERPHMVERTVWRETERIYGVDFQKAIRLEGPLLPNFVPSTNPAPFCGKMLSDFNRGFWGKIQLEMPPHIAEQRQDVYNQAFDRRTAHHSRQLEAPRPAQAAVPRDVRKALPSPREEVRLPAVRGAPAQREKVPVPAGGLFDGW